MTALLRGELIKTVSTRTLFGDAVTGVALAIANVVIVTSSRATWTRCPTSRKRSPVYR
jgi:hypothetical protein